MGRWPPCELELAFQTSNELKIPDLKSEFKAETNAHGTKKV